MTKTYGILMALYSLTFLLLGLELLRLGYGKISTVGMILYLFAVFAFEYRRKRRPFTLPPNDDTDPPTNGKV